jgi:hypothetical protein
MKYRFKAYETIYTTGSVPNWDENREARQDWGYRIVHRLVIKDSAKTTTGK